MGKQEFFFLAGMQRSGSTVLGAILSQHPDIYVTPSSFVFHVNYAIQDAWTQIPEAKASGSADQLHNIFGGVLHSAWSHIPKKYIVDKHRAWPRNLYGLGTILNNRKPKIICTVRDIPEVMASLLTLLRKSAGENRFDQYLMSQNVAVDDENRCDLLWKEMIEDAWRSLRIGWDTDRSCLHLVEYNEIVNQPREVLEGIHRFLGVPIPEGFQYDLENVQVPVEEDDTAWGIPNLHQVRPKVKRVSPSAEEILGPVLYAKYRDQNLEFWK